MPSIASIERHRECSREYARQKVQHKRIEAFSKIASQLPSWCKFSDLRKISQLLKHHRFGPMCLGRVYELLNSGEILSWKVDGIHRVSCDYAIALYYEKLRVKPDHESLDVQWPKSFNPANLRSIKDLHQNGAFGLMRWQRAYRISQKGYLPVWNLGSRSSGPKLYSCKEFIEQGLERFKNSHGYKFPFSETYYGRHRVIVLAKARERYKAQKETR